jgi:hypothetical protein
MNWTGWKPVHYFPALLQRPLNRNDAVKSQSASREERAGGEGMK